MNNYCYTFPAVKGLQANENYYICMVPLGLLLKLFPIDNDYVDPEYRAQRKLNLARIPEIKNYILSNRNSYVFSALCASFDGEFSFKPLDDTSNLGNLIISMNATFLINDGQHRRAAIKEAIIEDPTLQDETIPVVMFLDKGLSRSQQMFTDLNKHAINTTKSLNALYDSNDPLSVLTKKVVNSVPFLKKYTDKEKDNLVNTVIEEVEISEDNNDIIEEKETKKKEEKVIANSYSNYQNTSLNNDGAVKPINKWLAFILCLFFGFFGFPGFPSTQQGRQEKLPSVKL